jgi:hypothetical protein
MPTGRYFCSKTHMWLNLNVDGRQCCQLPKISAAKHKSGRLKISAAGITAAEFFGWYDRKHSPGVGNTGGQLSTAGFVTDSSRNGHKKAEFILEPVLVKSRMLNLQENAETIINLNFNDFSLSIYCQSVVIAYSTIFCWQFND